MNEKLQGLANRFSEERQIDHVVHTSQTVQKFADLTAQVVEQTEDACIEMFMQSGAYGSVLTRLLEDNSQDSWETPIAEVRISFPDHLDRLDKESRTMDSSYLATIDSFESNLRGRRVIPLQEQPNKTFDEGLYRKLHLSIDSEPLADMSPIAQLVCEALQNGIPLGKTDSQPEKMRFSHYSAGLGRIGKPRNHICGWGYVLEREDEIYIVSSRAGSFIIDQNDHVLRTLGVSETMCYDCDFTPLNLADKLEITLAERNLDGKNVFFVGNYTGPSEGACCGDMVYKAKNMLEQKGANVFATVDKMKDLL